MKRLIVVDQIGLHVKDMICRRQLFFFLTFSWQLFQMHQMFLVELHFPMIMEHHHVIYLLFSFFFFELIKIKIQINFLFFYFFAFLFIQHFRRTLVCRSTHSSNWIWFIYSDKSRSNSNCCWMAKSTSIFFIFIFFGFLVFFWFYYWFLNSSFSIKSIACFGFTK